MHAYTSIHLYIYACVYIYTSIHLYIHGSLHLYIHTSIHLYIHTSIHLDSLSICTPIHLYMHLYYQSQLLLSISISTSVSITMLILPMSVCLYLYLPSRFVRPQLPLAFHKCPWPDNPPCHQVCLVHGSRSPMAMQWLQRKFGVHMEQLGVPHRRVKIGSIYVCKHRSIYVHIKIEVYI